VEETASEKKPKISKGRKSTRKITLADGTVIRSNENDSRHLRDGKSGKHVYPAPVPDKEEILPDPEDEFTNHRYPPPRKEPTFRKTWMSFIDNVTERDNFKPGHLHTLEILCDLYVELEELNKFIRMNGMSFKVVTVAGEHRRLFPEVTQRDKVRAQIQHLTKNLDLFPKKDKTGPAGTSDVDEWS